MQIFKEVLFVQVTYNIKLADKQTIISLSFCQFDAGCATIS